MNDECKKELMYEILLLQKRCTDPTEFERELWLITAKYQISKETTELTLYYGERNEALLKKFIVGKMVKGCTERTIEAYTTSVRFFFRRVQKAADEVTPDDIRCYLAYRMQRDGVSEVTADNELRYLKAFYGYLYSEEVIDCNPAARVDKIKCVRTSKEALTEREIEQLRNNVKDIRESALFEIMLSTGCRVSELVNIKLSEIKDNRILVHGKGKKDRYVYLGAKAKLDLEDYLKERKDESEWLFPSPKCCTYWQRLEGPGNGKHMDTSHVEAIMRKLAKRAGVARANPHKLRRTCATMALRRGMDLTLVSKMLGHEQLDTTKIYLDINERDLELAHERYVL